MENNLANEINQNIVKIVIRTSSGYWGAHYQDKLSITADSIKYEYHEFSSTEPLKWSYSTNNRNFQQQLDVISKKLIEILDTALPKDYLALDVGGLDFSITYANKKRLKKTMMVPNDYFKDVFVLIKPIIPQFEQIPVFMHSYDEDDCDDDHEFSGALATMKIDDSEVEFLGSWNSYSVYIPVFPGKISKVMYISRDGITRLCSEEEFEAIWAYFEKQDSTYEDI